MPIDHRERAFEAAIEHSLLNEGGYAKADPAHFDRARYVFDKALEGFFIDRMEQNQDIFAKFMNDAEFKSTVAAYLRSQVYQQIGGRAQI
jgi:type I restriction enzyme, R subunit